MVSTTCRCATGQQTSSATWIAVSNAAFPMAGGTPALLAGEGDEHLMAAVRAADAGEALVQIAALEKGRHGALDDRPPEAVLGLESLVVDLLEGRKPLVHQRPQAGGLRIAWTVQRQGLDTRGGHGRQGSGPGIVYTLSLEPLIPSRQAGVSSLGRNCQRPHQLCRGGVPPQALPRVENTSTATLKHGTAGRAGGGGGIGPAPGDTLRGGVYLTREASAGQDEGHQAEVPPKHVSVHEGERGVGPADPGGPLPGATLRSRNRPG